MGMILIVIMNCCRGVVMRFEWNDLSGFLGKSFIYNYD